MKRTIYTVIVVICTAVILTIFTGAGYFIGINQDFMIDINSVNTLEKEVMETAALFNQIKHLEKGEVQQAKQLINMQLDASITTLDTLLQYYPQNRNQQENRASSVKLLTEIARFRAKHPETYNPPVSNQNGVKPTHIIDEILEKYRSN